LEDRKEARCGASGKVAVRRFRVPALLAFVVAGSVVLVGATGGGEPNGPAKPDIVAAQGDRPAQATAGELPCTPPGEGANFGLYSLGPSHQGLPLTTIIRRCDYPSPNGRANYVSYIYGDCDPAPVPGEKYVDGGCAPPLEVQVWPACERSVADYDFPAPELAERRGVPSAAFADRVELYTGASTVVVFAASQEAAEQAAGAVEAAPPDVSALEAAESAQPSTTLPSPVAGAVNGALRCSSPEAEGGS
jgi:hypothetical protein